MWFKALFFITFLGNSSKLINRKIFFIQCWPVALNAQKPKSPKVPRPVSFSISICISFLDFSKFLTVICFKKFRMWKKRDWKWVGRDSTDRVFTVFVHKNVYLLRFGYFSPKWYPLYFFWTNLSHAFCHFANEICIL